MTQLYVLFEHAVGYCLFKVQEFEEIGSFIPQVEEAVTDPSKFQKVVHLAAFKAFKNAAAALENINSISEGILSNDLSAFLQSNMPNPGKNTITLGVGDPKLGAAINETLGYPVTQIGVVPEILRGIRFHLTHLIKGLNPASMKQSELGLGHSYSRGKVKFNVNRVDNMIIQSIALVDQLDKDINTFTMKIREWYSYHFPELAKVVTDNYQYALCANLIKDRNLLNRDMFDELEKITSDSAKAQAIFDVARMSMGMDISSIDLANVEVFAKKVASLAEYRKKLTEYLRSKMSAVAPNLATLIGDVVGARLISHAGSLTNLAKYPASTVQILGAEKALFRALKVRGKTPKYGLIFHSSFIGKAGTINKGRISRYLANKCSLASRIDCFSDVQTNIFGQKLKGQVEDRLKFYEVGELPKKNIDVMSEAALENEKLVKQIEKKDKMKRQQMEDSNELNGSVHENGALEVEEETPHKKKKKRKSMPAEDVEVEMEQAGGSAKKKKRKSQVEPMDTSMNNFQFDYTGDVETSAKKKKKKKTEEEAMDTSLNTSAFDTSQIEEDGEQKKKKKKKRQEEQEENLEVSLETSILDNSAVGDDESIKKKKKKRKSHSEEC